MHLLFITALAGSVQNLEYPQKVTGPKMVFEKSQTSDFLKFKLSKWSDI